MKLLDLLVKELPKRGGWPEGADFVAQDGCGGFIKFGAMPIEVSVGRLGDNGAWQGKWNYTYIKDFSLDDIACDWSSQIVIRAQYESALAASEGWIEWGGGECPVDDTELVEVKYRDGRIKNPEPAGIYIWTNGHLDKKTTSADIIAYRLHKPEINSRANDDRLEQDLNECIGQDVVNHPSHYTKGNIECIDAIDSATTGKSGIEAVCVANVIKYLWRYEEKNGLEDVKKAQWYLNKLISELESN